MALKLRRSPGERVTVTAERPSAEDSSTLLTTTRLPLHVRLRRGWPSEAERRGGAPIDVAPDSAAVRAMTSLAPLAPVLVQ
ncbi:MAG: hypothetical protein H0U13_12505 [Gemmatimonadaceae bacterium]|nr:hypothetical protein [Gemmatimonadaceae bacterium]